MTSDNTFGTAREDALRRDFTINGLFYDISDFSVIDYVGGLDDLEAGLLRTIGDAQVRFREDPVRMLRGVEFASRLGFAITPEERAQRLPSGLQPLIYNRTHWAPAAAGSSCSANSPSSESR